MKYLTIFIVFFFVSLTVFSQEEIEMPEETIEESNIENDINENYESENVIETEAEAETEIDTEIYLSETIFVINSFEFTSEGRSRTRNDALIRKGELKTGEELHGISELEYYINDKTQILYNERVLEKVTIDYTVGEPDEEGRFPVDVTVNTRDTWNIVAIPRPKFSTNSGFDITIKARDYNFFGTMSPLRLDLGYFYNEDKEHSYLFMLDSNIPFSLFGLNWNFRFVNTFNYRPDTSEPIYYRNITGLFVDLPISFTTLTLGFDESFYVNQEHSLNNQAVYGEFQEGFFMTSRPYLSWKIPTGIDVYTFGEIIYTPGISVLFPHEFSRWPLDDPFKGPVASFTNNIGFDRIDWYDNFRRGMDVSVSNTFNFDFYRYNNDKTPWSSNLDISGTGHFILKEFLGISSRLRYRHWFLQDKQGYELAGDVLRGVLDKNLNANYMLSLNLDINIKALRAKPSNWFNNNKLRILNFDFHVVPFIDFAILQDYVNRKEFIFKDSVTTAGMEVIIFPEFFRSLFLVASIGWDIRNSNGLRDYELFIGTEFSY